MSVADIVIADVYFALFFFSFSLMFTSVFLLNVVYFSVCLTSNKLYWIEDQLADVSAQFYTSTSWRRQVGLSAS